MDDGLVIVIRPVRLPEPLLEAVKATAKARGVPYTRFIREVLEQATEQPDKPGR